MIRAVVFDLGGVIEVGDVIDKRVAPDWLTALCAERGWDTAELGRRFAAADARGDPPHDELRASYRTAFDFEVGDPAFESFWTGFWDWYCGELNTELWAFITTELLGRVRLGVLSNSGAGARVEEERRYGLSRVFDPIVYSHEIGVAKPDPRAFRVLGERLDLPLDRICFVDDRPENLAAAERFGITTVRHTEGATRDAVAALRAVLGGVTTS